MDNHRLFELIAQLRTASDYGDIQDVCSAFCHALEFDHFIYGKRIPTSFVKPSYIIVNGYPDEWRSRYIDQDYLMIDPTVSHCMTNTTPIYWERIMQTSCTSDDVIKKLFYEADDFGLRNGISYPIHNLHGESAMLSIATSVAPKKSKAQIESSITTGFLFASYVDEAVTRIPNNGLKTTLNAHLTDREKECLLWTTEGKTSWEISQILQISERTVVFHLNNAIKKLNVCNKQHAVARAILLGHISPQF